MGTFGSLADEDHDNVNDTLIEEEATLSSFDSDAVSDSEWEEEDNLVVGRLKREDKPLQVTVINWWNDQSPQDNKLGTISDERKDNDEDHDDLVPLSQFQGKHQQYFVTKQVLAIERESGQHVIMTCC